MKNQRRILSIVLCVLMLVTAIPFSPVMAEDAGTTEAVQPVAMLDGKAPVTLLRLLEHILIS